MTPGILQLLASGMAVIATICLIQSRSLARRLDAAEAAAVTDPLTGLFNRDGLRREFERVVVASGERDHIGIALIDLDDFKSVNDAVGHSIGDQVLRDVSRRLEACRIGGRPVCAARLGGDEFALLFRLTQEQLVAGDAVGALATLAERPTGTGPSAVRLSAGYATAPAPLADLSTLLAQADAAMYRAKRSGSGRMRSYDAKTDGTCAALGRQTVRRRDRRVVDAEVRG